MARDSPHGDALLGVRHKDLAEEVPARPRQTDVAWYRVDGVADPLHANIVCVCPIPEAAIPHLTGAIWY